MPCNIQRRPSNPTPRRARASARRSFTSSKTDATDSESANLYPEIPFFRRSPYRQFLLLLSLAIYQLAGAMLFLLCEAADQAQREWRWERELDEHRRILVEKIVTEVQLSSANDTQIAQTIQRSLLSALVGHDKMLLEWRGKHPQMRWDFWNAMLFSLSIFTTIGYGHLYARTLAGRILTMLYALGGIPLLMLVLDELGRLLSRMLRAGWFLLKCACRRAFRNCTRQTSPEIRNLDAEDRQELSNSIELPLGVALGALFLWISLCAGLACLLWNGRWDFQTAFYFLFTSLTTIGLGDVTPPSEPRQLLLLSVCLIIGLALVSMAIGLVQAKCSRPYSPSHPRMDDNNNLELADPKLRLFNQQIQRGCGSSLGVFSTNTSSSRGSAVRERLRQRLWHNKCTQTLLSFPSPAIRDARVTRAVTQNGLKSIPHTLSVDDVMRLVDTEEGDILLLTELTLSRDISGLSGETNTSSSEGLFNGAPGAMSSSTSGSATIWTSDSVRTTTSSSDDGPPKDGQQHLERQHQQLVLSRSFDRCCPPPMASTSAAFAHHQAPVDMPLVLPLFSSILGHPPSTMNDLELLEELEDRMLLSHGGDDDSRNAGGRHANRVQMPIFPYGKTDPNPAGVHFRSRLSLIPEQHSLDEEQEAAELGEGFHFQQPDALVHAQQIDLEGMESNHAGRNKLKKRQRPSSTSWSGSLSALIKGSWKTKKQQERSASLSEDPPITTENGND